MSAKKTHIVKFPSLDLRCPTHLKGHAAKHWKRVAPLLDEMGVLKPCDLPALESLCQWWAEYQKLQETPAATSGEAYKRSIAMASCFKHYGVLAGKFGLTPKDREALRVKEPLKSDPAAEFVQ